METASFLIGVVQGYCLVGAVVALAFLTVGMDRLDEDARGAYVFRPLLIPGILLIWPLLLWRWFCLETGRGRWQRLYAPPREAHGVAAWIMAVLIVLSLATGFAVRQTWPADVAPVQIAPPEDAT